MTNQSDGDRSPSLEDRVVLVTGAAGDIGRAITAACLHAGARVALMDCEPLALQRAVDRELEVDPGRRSRVLPVQADVADPDQVQAAVAQVVERFGTIAVLVNNAATDTPSARVCDASPD